MKPGTLVGCDVDAFVGVLDVSLEASSFEVEIEASGEDCSVTECTVDVVDVKAGSVIVSSVEEIASEDVVVSGAGVGIMKFSGTNSITNLCTCRLLP